MFYSIASQYFQTPLICIILKLFGKLALYLGVAFYDHAWAVDDARHAGCADMHRLAVFMRLDKDRIFIVAAF